MQAFVRSAIAAMLGAAMLLALIVGPILPQLRFAGDLRSVGTAILGRSGDVDVVFAGTSRTMASVEVDKLAPIVSRRLGREVVMYDLATSGTGSDVNYLVLKELLKRAKVQLIVLEVPSGSQFDNHFYFIQMASWRDLLDNALRFDDPIDRLIRTIRLKISIFATELTSGRWFQAPETPEAGGSYDTSSPRPADVLRLQAASEKGRVTPRPIPLGSRPGRVANIYVRELLDLARQRGVDVVLITIPGLAEEARSAEEKNDISQYYGADIIGISKYDLQYFTPHHYADESHHGVLANDKYSPILAEWIASRLNHQENKNQ